MAHRDRDTSDNEGKGLSLSHLIETTWESTSPTLNRNAEVSQKERVGGITQPWNTIMQHCNEANASMQSQFLHVLATLEFTRQPAPHSYIMHTYNYMGVSQHWGAPNHWFHPCFDDTVAFGYLTPWLQLQLLLPPGLEMSGGPAHMNCSRHLAGNAARDFHDVNLSGLWPGATCCAA